jgi:hypothetical protein
MSLKSQYGVIEQRRDEIIGLNNVEKARNQKERDRAQKKIWKLEEEARKMLEPAKEEMSKLQEENVTLNKVPGELIELQHKADRLDEQIRMLSMYDLFKRGKVDLSMPDKIETYGRNSSYKECRVEFLGDIKKDEFSVIKAYAVENDKKVNSFSLVYLGKSVFFKSRDYGLRIKDDRQFDIQLQGRSLPSPDALKPFVKKDWESSKVWEKYKLALLDFSEIINELVIDEVPVSIMPYRCGECGNVITKRQLSNWSAGYDFKDKCPSCEAPGFSRKKAA